MRRLIGRLKKDEKMQPNHNKINKRDKISELKEIYGELVKLKLWEKLILSLFGFYIVNTYIGFSGQNGLAGSIFLLIYIIILWFNRG